ncbi:glycoside hydrolase family 18 [Ruminiclostridium papyrosolvens DSM 2782]|uniref:Glycoside hydrolase family 18 n=1 Tax=Ruminiclostridium papyrosolvens DSM 2782 TaxID=588581 RepID=F1TGV9_9FIRM|nr:leucine-rich repeat domain-containing protein [Ruminiclostridium papyrosolvens]EGD46440.1 glycoside hydrolase family 18 [Ruminiclostridium papyrosolvens DSM 2782]WES33947.1 leucine-rich repeat domain-containing protein [Ruminiclostridium papyrosolvens DSM 2782]
MKMCRTLICVMLILAMAFGFVFPVEPIAQAAEVKELDLHAFYPSRATFSDSIKKYIDSLDSVSFLWGRFYGDLTGGINTTYGKNGNTDFYYPDDYIEVLKYAKSKNKSIQMGIFSDSANAEKILPYKEQRDKAIQAITDLMKSDISKGSNIFFDGVVIDIEGLNGQKMSGFFNQFLKELKLSLTKINKKLYVAVNPLLYYSGYDYSTISQVADKMIIMAHDYEPLTKLTKEQVMQYTGYDSLNPIDSLAPIKQIQRVMEDVKKYVSKSNLKKIMLQISFDAAQWRFQVPKGSTWKSIGKKAVSLEVLPPPTYKMLYDRIINKDGNGKSITYGYNYELESSFMQYFNTSNNTQNICLYENSRSVAVKIDMSKQYGIGGISLWSLSNVPDYTSSTAKGYGLDVWDAIIKSLYKTVPVSQIKATFTDKVVEKAVRAKISKPSGTVYRSDLAKVYRLKIPAGYKSLNDLKQLFNLEYLDLSNTQLTSVSSLASLKNLRVLYLYKNSIKDISPLKGLTKLEVISINSNKVSNISALAGMTNLTELYIRENAITDYSPLTKLKNLNILYLKGNKLTNYTKLQTIKKGLIECDF